MASKVSDQTAHMLGWSEALLVAHGNLMPRLNNALVANIDILSKKGITKVQMRRLVCTFLFANPRRQAFSHRGPHDSWG